MQAWHSDIPAPEFSGESSPRIRDTCLVLWRQCEQSMGGLLLIVTVALCYHNTREGTSCFLTTYIIIVLCFLCSRYKTHWWLQWQLIFNNVFSNLATQVFGLLGTYICVRGPCWLWVAAKPSCIGFTANQWLISMITACQPQQETRDRWCSEGLQVWFDL